MSEPTGASSSRLTHWTSLKRVDIRLEQTTVYNNGRQQLKLWVTVEALNDATPVELTEADFATLKLIDFANEQSIPFSDDEPDTDYEGWTAQRNDRGFDFQPTINPTLVSPTAMRAFYLSGSASASQYQLQVGFSITNLVGEVFLTTGWIVMGESRTAFREIEIREKFVRAIPAVVYPRTSFVMPLDDPDMQVFDERRELSIEHNGARVGIRRMTCSPASMIHWTNSESSNNYPCFTGYAGPGDQGFHWDLPAGNWKLPELGGVAPEGTGLVMLCGRNDITQDPGTTWPRAPMQVSIIDVNGSPQSCTISFVNGTRGQLQIT